MEWMLMPYRRYAEFSGRSRRMEYWMFSLFTAIVYAVCLGFMAAGGTLSALLHPGNTPPEMGVLFYIGAGILGLFGLASFVPAIAVAVRRFHDRNMSGWIFLALILASIIPLVGFLASIANFVLMCLPGTPGPNKYGADPLDPNQVEAFR